MTEKRFKVKSERINDTYSIHILEKGKVIFEVSNWNSLSDMHKKECEELVDIINEIVDDNEQLKQDGVYWAKTAEARRKEIDKLRKYNSILKQQRDYLFDVIDEVLPHSGSTTVYNRMKNIGDV